MFALVRKLPALQRFSLPKIERSLSRNSLNSQQGMESLLSKAASNEAQSTQEQQAEPSPAASRLNRIHSLRSIPEQSSVITMRRVVTLPDLRRNHSTDAFAVMRQVLFLRAHGQSWKEALRQVMQDNDMKRLNPEQSGYKYPVVLGEKEHLYELINEVPKKVSDDVCHILGIKVEDDFQFGEGNFGTVRLARDMDNSSYYAVKRVNKFKICSELAVQDSLPDHDNIVKAVDYALAPCREGWDNFHIFMPVAEYGDGLRFMEKWSAAMQQLDSTTRQDLVAHVTLQVVEGLLAMHEAGLAHLDIKPANLLFFADGRVALCDYSTSEQVDGPSRQRCGTREYMPPEQSGLNNQRGFDSQKADLWMLGVTLLEMFDFQNPYEQKAILAPESPSTEEMMDIPYLLKKETPDERISLEALRLAPCMLTDERRANGAKVLRELMQTTC